MALTATFPQQKFDSTQTFAEIDLVRDGRINPEEWMSLVKRNPGVIEFMTLPALKDLQLRGWIDEGKKNSFARRSAPFVH